MRLLKYILFFVCLLILGSISSIAQLVTPVGSVNTGQYQRGLYGADSAFGLPIKDTTGGYLTAFRYKARITLQPSTGNLYYHNGTRWVGIGGLYANGYGLALLGNVFSVDTTIIATRAFASSGFIKYADSNIIFVTPYAMNDSLINIRDLIATKLGIADSNLYVTPSRLLDSLAAHIALINGKVPYSTLNDTAAAIRASIPSVTGFVTRPELADSLTRYIRKGDTTIYVGTKQNIKDTASQIRRDMVWKADSTILYTTPTQLNTKHTQGGDSRGATIVIGSNDANSFAVRTNGVNRKVISTTGMETDTTTGIEIVQSKASNLTTSKLVSAVGSGTAFPANFVGIASYVGNTRNADIMFNGLVERVETRGLRTWYLGTTGGVVMRSAWNANANPMWDYTLSIATINTAGNINIGLRIFNGTNYVPTAAQSMRLFDYSGHGVNHARTDAPYYYHYVVPGTFTTASLSAWAYINLPITAYGWYSFGNSGFYQQGFSSFGTTTIDLNKKVLISGGLRTDSITATNLGTGNPLTDSTLVLMSGGRFGKVAPTQGTLTGDTTSASTLSLSTNIWAAFKGTTTTWTLPSLSGNFGRYYILVNDGSSNITLTAAAGTLKDGGSVIVSKTIAVGEVIRVLNIKTHWVITN